MFLTKKAQLLLLSLSLCSFNALADDNASDLNTENCVASKWKDANGNPISIDEKFGPGSMAATRCLANTKAVKSLYQINALCKDAACTAPYALGNIQNHINDLTITHGMDADDYEIAVVVHAGGWKLVLNNNSDTPHAATNPFQSAMEAAVANPRIKVMFCANTAAKKGIKLSQMIPGIKFSTAGVSAISDLQEEGYRYIQP
ncbi:MAG: DsrE family protein [Gammaproteobacteria bacterium]|nr:DsrE family protein [Gammaproteobacteria bacterium]